RMRGRPGLAARPARARAPRPVAGTFCGYVGAASACGAPACATRRIRPPEPAHDQRGVRRSLRVEQPELRPRRRAAERCGGECRLPRVDPRLARGGVEQRAQLPRIRALAAHARAETALVQLAAAHLAHPSELLLLP